MQTPSESIRNYIRAKDENRPHLMSRAFAETATLEIIVKTGAISFPPLSRGLDSIADVVRRFAQAFENVYTLCLTNPPKSDDRTFSCDWLVGMSEKETGAVRVDCGHYDWLFQPKAPCLVEKGFGRPGERPACFRDPNSPHGRAAPATVLLMPALWG